MCHQTTVLVHIGSLIPAEQHPIRTHFLPFVVAPNLEWGLCYRELHDGIPCTLSLGGHLIDAVGVMEWMGIILLC